MNTLLSEMYSFVSFHILQEERAKYNQIAIAKQRPFGHVQAI